MSDRVDEILSRLSPRGPDTSLRDRVLDVVDEELVRDTSTMRPAASQRRSREGRLLAATAAAVVLAVGLNFAVAARNDALEARLFGPAPTPRSIAEIVDAVESVTDRETAHRVRQQLIAARSTERRGNEAIIRHYERLLAELADAQGRTRREDREMDRHRTGDIDRDTTHRQRHLGVAEWRQA